MRLIQDITLGQYLPVSSFLHRLDPRSKTIFLFFFIIYVFRLDSSLSLLFVLLNIAALLLVASIPLKYLISGLSFFVWLFVFTAVFHFFLTPGDPLSLFPYVTAQGLDKGIIVFLQLFAVIVAANVFTLTTSPGEMVKGFERLLLPFRFIGINTKDSALMVMLVIRFIPLLKEETLKVSRAQRSRGIRPDEGTFVLRAKKTVALILPVLSRFFFRAETMAIAMVSRGYMEGVKKNDNFDLKYGKGDFAVLTLVLLFMFLLFLKY